MRFTGTFKNYENNKRYKVTIGRDGESWMPITDPTMQEFKLNNEVCFDVDPVHITCTRDDLQQRILIRQCTIELKTKLDMSSMLIADTNRTIPVKVEIVNDEGDAPQSICTIFDGFMDPLTFNQGMAHNYESFTIHATDPMGALENLKVDALEDNEGNYAQDKIEYIGQLLPRLFSVADMTMYTNEDFGPPYPNHPGNNERVNMQVFFGEDQDDWMTLHEILDTICKFNGYLAYYNPIDGYAHVTSMYDPLLIQTDIDLEHNVLDEDTQISTDDVYSQVTLQCDIEPNDDDVSLLDDDFLYSDYKNYQKYMTELAVSGQGWDELNAFQELCNSTDGKEYTSNTNGRRTEHFCHVLRNDAWSFGSNSYITTMNGAEETDENDAVKMTGDQSNVLTWLKNNPGKGAFIQFGKGNDIKTSNTAPTGAPKMTDYLVISIQGHNDHRVSGGHYDSYSSIFSANNVVCEYIGLASKNLTPPDDTITNYLLISGKMILNPLQKKTGINWTDDTGFPTNWHDNPSYMNLYNASTNTFSITKSCLNSTDNDWLYKMIMINRDVPSNDDRGEYYTQKWWSCSDPANPSYSVKGNEGLIGFLGNKNNEICQYAWSEHGEENDEIDKMPVLVCSLKIGNKWAVEIFNSSYDPHPNSNYDYKKGKIVWMTEEQWGTYGIEPVFSIGFDPQIDDKFVGHEYKFANNVVESMKIEGDGMAIPITYGDKLNGKIEFKILRPYNSDTQFNRIERVHPTWLRSTSWNDHCFWILEFLDSIMISDLKLEIKTDAAKINQKLTTSDNDLVYYSATHPDYIEKLEDETKICSALTMDECQKQGIKYQTSNSYVLDGEDMFLGWAVGNNKVRPEEMFVDYYFQHCCGMGARVGQNLTFLMRILETTVKDTVLLTQGTSGYSNVDDLGYKMATGWLGGDLSYGMDNPIQYGALMSFDWSLAKREMEIKIREMNPNCHSVWS